MSIGGYFELELGIGTQCYHSTPHALKSGRAALHYILHTVRPALVHIPYYTCDALLEPFALTGTPYRFYAINHLLEPAIDISLAPGEYMVYVNYFGIKNDKAAQLSVRHGDKLITDATQAFFLKGDGRSWLVNSCRKFFGVPDGSYLYTPAGISLPVIADRNEEYETAHLLKRFNGHTREGYEYFVRNEEMTDGRLLAMSLLSERLLSYVDYTAAAEKRKANFAFLHSRLGHLNTLHVHPSQNNVPMYYPLLPHKYFNKAILQQQDIFIPSFWNEVSERSIGFDFEKQLAGNLWPLPVDHRYTEREMEILSDAVINTIKRA